MEGSAAAADTATAKASMDKASAMATTEKNVTMMLPKKFSILYISAEYAQELVLKRRLLYNTSNSILERNI